MQKPTRFLVRCLGLTLFLAFPLVARADFASDLQEPLQLLQSKKFNEAAVALDKIAPQYQNQFALHYMLGLANLGRVNDKLPAADNIKFLRQSRAALLKALPLADNDEKKKETRDLMKAGEEGLKALGVALEPEGEAPAATTDADENKQQEIEELRRRLAELEGKPATNNPTQPATPAAATLPVGPPNIPGTLPKLAPLKPTPKTARGRVINRSGKPMAGVEVSISGTTLAGERTSFYPKTNAQGIFSTPVPNGIYTTRAEIKTTYNGHSYIFPLYPLDGDYDSPQDSREGVVEDYVWCLSGLRPAKTEEEDKPWNYYGGQVEGGFGDVGSYGVISDTQAPKEMAEFPNGFRVDVTFTPEGPLADGGPGRAFSYSKSYKPMTPTAPYGNTSFRMNDVPAGRYTVRARLTTPEGASRDLLLTTRRFRPLQTPAVSQVMEFEPDNSNLRPVYIALYAWPVENK